MKPKRYFRSPLVLSSTIRCGAPLFTGFAILITGLGTTRAAIYGGSSSSVNPSNPQPGSAPAGGTTPTASDAARSNARQTLLRTRQAVGAMKAMQDAARAAALANPANNLGQNPNNPGQTLPDVPNGLGQGGLQPAPGAAINSPNWQGANLPSQTEIDGLTNVTIRQTAQQALLNWTTFNVGKNTTLTFDQSAGGANASQWIAFNKVSDPSANPTQILGNIQAQGQVYLINQNGILFGGGSRINVHTLTASTLPINDNLVARGLLNNPGGEFLFNALGQGKAGDITVQAGAGISTPVSADGNGGRIFLTGANVTNNGTLTSPAGQIILASGLQVGIAAHATTDPSLRGLDVFIGAVTDPASALSPYAGTTTNNGLIDIPRASALLTGKTVNQNGIIDSTTSVSLNGRIDLNANYDAVGNIAFNPSNATFGPTFLNRSTGTVTFGEGSVTRILPELDSDEKITGSTLALVSQINATGNVVHFDNNAILLAPNANVTVNAGTWFTKPASTTDSPPVYSFFRSGGRIDLDAGALIDVSGSQDVKSSVASNIVEAQLRGSELANSPLLRDGALRGETIFVDITKTGTYNGQFWIGSPIADVSGYANLVQRSVGELTIAGGTVSLNAGDAVVMRDQSAINVSAGWVNFQSGTVETTKVISNGQIIDISEATPDRVYDGIYDGKLRITDPKWGVTETYGNALSPASKYFQKGFTRSGAGGSLKINSAAMVLDGILTGSTFAGDRQRETPPAAASLSLSFTSERLLLGLPSTYSPSAPDVIFASENDAAHPGDFSTDENGAPTPIPADRRDQVMISPSLLGPGNFGALSIYTPDGDISLGAGVTLNAGYKGSVDLSGANVTIDGSIIASGGSISVKTYNLSPAYLAELGQTAILPPPSAGRGLFNLGANAKLNVAGGIVDDRPTSTTPASPNINITGGSISIATYSANLSSGSLIDTSGGAYVNGSGKITYGNAGSVSIKAGNDISLAAVTGGILNLAGEMRGFSGAKGGSLSIQTQAVKVGGNAPGNANTLWLQPDFFDQGGFSSFNLTGDGFVENGVTTPGITIADGTRISPKVVSLTANVGDQGGAISLTPIIKPAGLASPISLSFTSLGVVDLTGAPTVVGQTYVGAGSLIDAGPLGSISLSGNTVELHGALRSNGGSIRITGAGKLPSLNEQTSAHTTVLIGSDASLDASGSTLLVPDNLGRLRGAILDGGTIRVSGNIVAQEGAILNVSGGSGMLDLLGGEIGNSLEPLLKPYAGSVTRTHVESNGGTLVLAGGEMLMSDATLLGNSGGTRSTGGTLQLSSGKFNAPGSSITPLDPTLIVKSSGPVLPAGYAASIGAEAPVDATGISGGGRFSVDRFSNGGFANLDLSGTIRFADAVTIQAAGRITAGTSPVLLADSTVTLKASYVSLGTAFQAPMTAEEKANFDLMVLNGSQFFVPPTHGTSTLTVSASLIDVGYLATRGFSKVELNADNGDIRGSGTLAVAGDISLRAGQIYSPTSLDFTIAAFDYAEGSTIREGSVTITGSGTRSLPLSAGSSLNVYGSVIHQNGVLRAPFGTIRLGWNGSGTAPHDNQLSNLDFAKTRELVLGGDSVTSVSAIDPLTGKGVVIPYGLSLNGTNWLNPAGEDITSGGAPQKSILLSAESVVTSSGSQVDIRGGGDLMAYRWVSGLGGTIDILASNGSFAVVPGYGANYAPTGAFNASLGATAGYTNPSLRVGDQIRIDGGGGLAAGIYTLLPARYALLPGAYLVTPKSGSGVGTVLQADGSTIVSGYRFNGLDSSLEIPNLTSRFEVAPASTVAARAEYTRLSANAFLTPTGGYRLPGDSGQLVFSGSRAMGLSGNVLSAASAGYRGGMIDISSPIDIFISGNASAAPAGTLVLDPALLSGFGAESLLIGGFRSPSTEGAMVTTTTTNLTLENSGSPLSGPEIILTAKDHLTLAQGSQIEQKGGLGGNAETLVIGTTNSAGSGNAAVVRVSSDFSASLIRHGVTPGGSSSLVVGENAIIKGASIILDSSALNSLSASAIINTQALSLGAGRISLALDPSMLPGADAGLVLTNAAILSLSASNALSLASYSSIDLLGAGVIGGRDASGTATIGSLSLTASEIRGLGTGTGEVVFNAKNIVLSNPSRGTPSSPALPNQGQLTFHADTIALGAGTVSVRGFSDLLLDGDRQIQTTGNGGLSANGNLKLDAPVIFSTQAVSYEMKAAGNLSITGDGSNQGVVSSAGLGSTISFTGSTIDVSSRIVLPSGKIALHATNGDLIISGSLEAGGTDRIFKDQTRYTSGGIISLIADAGDITLSGNASLNLSAKPGGGDAGTLSVSAVHGQIKLLGLIDAHAGATQKSGNFTLDVGDLTSLASLDGLLNQSGFNESRSFRIRNGNVSMDGFAKAASYTLAADSGSILMTGSIDASGKTGGAVRLVANQGITLATKSSIDAWGLDFDSAGKGGSVAIESRGANGGVIQLDQNSSIKLGVNSATAASAAAGKFTGTLQLRAPRLGGGAGNEIAIGTIGSTITGASHIIVEGDQTYDLTSSGGLISTAIQNSVKTDATNFMVNSTAIENRILANQSALGSLLTVRPGVEIINTTGDLTLGGTTTSGNAGDWNLASFRFGGEQVPGALTFRAAGNLIFLNSLTDGFTSGAYTSGLMARNDALPDNVQGWSYQLISGADFSAADGCQVKDLSLLAADSGSLKLGKNGGDALVTGGANALTSTLLNPASASGLFQVIRTGSGDIDIVASRDIQLLNNIASIYTAGTLVADPTMGGTFDTPRPTMTGSLVGSLGAIQQPTPSPVQYSLGGGNVSLSAGNDIAHYTRTALGALIADSSREMPINWLYRRGFIDPLTGQSGTSKFGESASATWWVDFTNFFEGIGALGGGNVTLNAGRDVSNVDAVAPTNARMPKGQPNSNSFIELGGGDVTVLAGRNIDGGTYYVERGSGTLHAGASITTNATRSPSLVNLRSPASILDSSTWLATTLFAGKAQFSVSAANDVLLGPVVNPFLLPQGYNNTYWYKTWFSTYAPDSAVNVSSLGGSVTLRNGTSTNSGVSPALQTWFENELRLTTSPASASFFQPWLRLSESQVAPFSSGFSLMPGNLSVTAFTGGISLVGNLTLSPSATGSLDLLAAGSVGGLNISGKDALARNVWTSSTINLSDADPLLIPSFLTPRANQVAAGTVVIANRDTSATVFNFLTQLFAETGSTNGASQAKQLLHTAGGLHANDENPLRIYSGTDITDVQLFSAKPAWIFAGGDIRDISFYLQNVAENSISIVSAGRDIIAYDSSTTALVNSLAPGNIRANGSAVPWAGDIQISGPGTLEVFAGRNLDLGVGGNNANGTGVGITSIGNSRNPFLQFGGADIIAGAGIGSSYSLAASQPDFDSFITQFIKNEKGTDHLTELGYTQTSFDALDTGHRDQVALQVFYLVLRDAGRDHNNPDLPGYGNYAAGQQAIATLFPGDGWIGEIDTRSRDVRTKNGGDITLFAPGGGLTLASTTIGNPLVPPGIVTEAGGNINIFTRTDIDLGISRIFTLKGGNEIIWSSEGNIAAGSSSKTVQSAPPTRVLIDPGSADVQTDLAGLATGGGIGVLTSVKGVAPSNVDLIAPVGTIDAGDAGIRVSGNLNISAAVVTNAGNISVGGSSAGSAPASVSASSVAVTTTASNTAAAATVTQVNQTPRETAPSVPIEESLSVITVEVIGYGGATGEEDEERKVVE